MEKRSRSQRSKILRGPDPRILWDELAPPSVKRKILSSRIVLLFDLDGSGFDSDPEYEAWLTAKLGRSIKGVVGRKRYSFREVSDDVQGLLVTVGLKDPKIYKHAKPRPYFASTIKQARKKDIAIVAWTARPATKKIEEVTIRQLRELGIEFDLLIMSAYKVDVLVALMGGGGCSVVVVDDHLDMLEQLVIALREANLIDDVAICLYATSYNDWQERSSEIVLIRDWRNVLGQITKLSKKRKET